MRLRILVALLTSCTLLSVPPFVMAADSGHDLDRLVSYMTGSFSSAEQSKADADFFDIRLKMARIWKDRKDGCWLYVEQAAADALDKPYRQRVYHVIQIDANTFESQVYTFENPLAYAGEWKKPEPLAVLTPESFTLKKGCSIVLKKKNDGSFAGSTTGKECPSDRSGATYATSEVVITEMQMVSWDRGFDADGKQVWGAEKGGYVFKKLSSTFE